MEELEGLANDYRAALLAAGCNAEVIASLPVLAAALKTADRNQEKFKKDRGVLTQDRVGYLNALYKLLAPIDAVARFIFKDDPTRLSKYSLPQPVQPSPEKPLPTAFHTIRNSKFRQPNFTLSRFGTLTG